MSDSVTPGFSVHGILQARVPEWVAMSSSRGSSCTLMSPPLAGRFFTTSTMWEAQFDHSLCFQLNPIITFWSYIFFEAISSIFQWRDIFFYYLASELTASDWHMILCILGFGQVPLMSIREVWGHVGWYSRALMGTAPSRSRAGILMLSDHNHSPRLFLVPSYPFWSGLRMMAAPSHSPCPAKLFLMIHFNLGTCCIFYTWLPFSILWSLYASHWCF